MLEAQGGMTRRLLRPREILWPVTFLARQIVLDAAETEISSTLSRSNV